MYKTIFSISLLLNCLLTMAQDTTAILAKAEVKKATEQEMSKARENVSNIIKNPAAAKSSFNNFVIIGPNLWNIMKDVNSFKDIRDGNVILKVPVFENDGSWKVKKDVTGKLLQTEEDFLKLFTWLNESLDLKSATIVTRNQTDEFLLWLYFAKIEEPVIIVQNDKLKLRLLFKFVEKGLFFIEMVNNPACILFEEE